MPRGEFLRLLLAVLAVAALSGCGDDGSERSDERRVREVALGYLRAIDHKDGPTACGHLMPALRKRFARAGETCRDEIVPIQRLGPNQVSNVVRVEVRGARAAVVAVVTAKGLGGTANRFDLVRAGRTWKIGRMTERPLPGPG